MDITTSFGYWVRRRRKALDLTQRALADRVGCAVVTVKKIEADARQPSLPLAERLADVLAVPPAERPAFLARARGLLASAQIAPESDPIPIVAANRAPLPAEPTPFIGRAAELQQLATRLVDPECRLLTLVGPGGVGKTRLALRAAAALQATRSICFVPLADIPAAQVAPDIAARLGLQEIGGQTVEHALIRSLRDREVLLILDNVEHLLAGDHHTSDDLPGFLARLLHACPQIKLLVTSRERLNLHAEWVVPVNGLLVEHDARALFVARAQRIHPAFVLADQEPIIDEICRLVEGMPLAIELAASWTPFLSCVQIQQQLEQGSELLATRLRDLPDRHRSLRALFDQSWNLLTDDERHLFAALSIFSGGFTAELIAVVCGAHMDALLALVEKSLVTSDGTGRYGLHVLARRYAAEQLAATGAAATVGQNHCHAYLALAERAASHFAGPAAVHWFDTLDTEQDNLRAALQWALHQPDTTLLYRLAHPLTRYWYARGRWQAGITWLQATLARTADVLAPARAAAFCWCGIMLARSGRAAEAIPYFRAGYTIAQQTEDAAALGLASLVMAAIDRDKGALDRHYAAAIELFRQTHDDEMLAMALYFWGDDLRMQRQTLAARAAYAESLRLYRHMGNQIFLAYPLGNLGRLALQEGDLATAQQNFAECVAYSRRNGNHISLVDWLTRLGSVAVYTGDLPAARTALRDAYRHANEIAYQSIIPNIQAWLALAEGVAGNHQLARQYLEQSAEGYASSIEAVAQAPLSDGSHLSRPDILDALVAAAYLHQRASHVESAVVLVSGIAHVTGSGGAHLDQPLQMLLDTVHSTCQKAVAAARYAVLWQQGQASHLAALLRLAASFDLRL